MSLQVRTNEINFKSYLLIKKLGDGLDAYMKTGETLFNKLLDAYIQMKMNEFEFSLWVLIVEKALADNHSEPMEILIKCSAYFYKKSIRFYIES